MVPMTRRNPSNARRNQPLLEPVIPIIGDYQRALNFSLWELCGLGCIPEKRYSPRWWRHPKDENVSLRAKRSNLFDRDCFVACAPRNDTPSSLMRCHCCSFDRLPLFWNAPVASAVFLKFLRYLAFFGIHASCL